MSGAPDDFWGAEWVEWRHGYQLGIAKFLDSWLLALWASGLCLRYATLHNLISSFPWIAPTALHPGTIQGKEGINFCHLATLNGGQSVGGGGQPAGLSALAVHYGVGFWPDRTTDGPGRAD